MKKNPLIKSESGTLPSNKKTVFKSGGKVTSAAKYRTKAPNSLRQNPGFKGSVR